MLGFDVLDFHTVCRVIRTLRGHVCHLFFHFLVLSQEIIGLFFLYLIELFVFFEPAWETIHLVSIGTGYMSNTSYACFDAF